MTSAMRQSRYAVTSRGLWSQRDDLSTVLDAEISFWPFCRAADVDGFVGWGRRPSGIKAVQLAAAHAKPVITLEDGFLKSYAPGRSDPAHSFVIDRKGIYFDARGDSALFDLIDATELEAAGLARASLAMTFLRDNRLSKYNNAPLIGLAEADLVGEAKAVIEAMKARGAEVPIPTDVVCAKSFSADAVATVKAATDVADDDMILDIGPQTAQLLAEQLKKAGTIVWNGPVGVFEFEAFSHGTEAIARAIAASSAFSIAGGGDTLAAIAKYGIEKQVGYISTGGGAFLEVLEGKTLPAFEILSRRAAG